MINHLFGGKPLIFFATFLAGLALIFAFYFAGFSDGEIKANSQWQQKWDQQVIALTKAKADALEVVRTEEQRRIKAIEEIRNESKKQIEQLKVDTAGANAAADSLHDKANRMAKAAGRCTDDTNTARRSASAATTSLVLADVLKRADQRAGELAAAYDRARASGLMCERAYDALHNASGVP